MSSVLEVVVDTFYQFSFAIFTRFLFSGGPMYLLVSFRFKHRKNLEPFPLHSCYSPRPLTLTLYPDFKRNTTKTVQHNNSRFFAESCA